MPTAKFFCLCLIIAQLTWFGYYLSFLTVSRETVIHSNTIHLHSDNNMFQSIQPSAIFSFPFQNKSNFDIK